MNLKIKLTTILFAVVLISQSGFSQDVASIAVPRMNSIITIEAAPENKVKKSSTKNLKDRVEAIYYDISDLDFISDIDLSTNTLKITSKDNVTYDRAQLTHLETNNTVAKIELSSSNNTMRLENIKPGKYILILSNDAGNIRSQELYIL